MGRRILFVPFGSEGDVNPLLWLAGKLAARGHEPVFLLTPHYGPLAARHGFEWYPIGAEEDFQRMASNPNLWKPLLGTWRVVAAMVESLPIYATAFQAAGGNFDLVVTSSFGLAASALAERAGIPRMMLHLQPACMRSVHDVPVFSAGVGWIRHLPDPFKRLAFRTIDVSLNRTLLPPLNRFRKSLGLPFLSDFYRDALFGSQGVALLFPDWFSAAQPDWPPHVRQYDFPIDPFTPSPLPPHLAEWLATGSPPILWTHGSANYYVDAQHTLALKVTKTLGERALLVSKQLPRTALPPDCLHLREIPFEQILPHCRAIAHHAGIGTTAKAFAAGIPQLALPLAHDQHDNALRIERAHAGRSAGLRRPPLRVANLLHDILTSREIAEGVRRCQHHMLQSVASSEALCADAEALMR